uniref:Uncharacterized protein n=1 Tax=viral metagenome TaxID=1070528 RepID=A0A6M3LNX6_9ZZZZ
MIKEATCPARKLDCAACRKCDAADVTDMATTCRVCGKNIFTEDGYPGYCEDCAKS